jgi:hypothetical protein
MEQAESRSVDRWNKYQSTRLKLHLAEDTRREIMVLATGEARPRAQAALAGIDADLARYKTEAVELSAQAKVFSARYDALNIHDDQFDASEALISTAMSLAAVAALVESLRLLAVCWAFGAFGMFMGVCGFAGWGFHPDLLSNFLG